MAGRLGGRASSGCVVTPTGLWAVRRALTRSPRPAIYRIDAADALAPVPSTRRGWQRIAASHSINGNRARALPIGPHCLVGTWIVPQGTGCKQRLGRPALGD